MTLIDDKPEANRLYPELLRLGGLAKALETVLHQHEGIQVVSREPMPGVAVKLGSRSMQVVVAKSERLYIAECWTEGIAVGAARIERFEDVVALVERWVLGDATLAQIASEFAFDAKPAGKALEAGSILDFMWENAELLASSEELKDLVRRAAKEPRLRELFPYWSMKRLGFSRVPGYPYSKDCPSVREEAPGKYQVFSAEPRLVGDGDAEYAIRLLIDLFPPDAT